MVHEHDTIWWNALHSPLQLPEWNRISACNSIYCAGNILRWHIFPFKSKQTREKLCKIAHKNYHCDSIAEWYSVNWKEQATRCSVQGASEAMVERNCTTHEMNCSACAHCLMNDIVCRQWYQAMEAVAAAAETMKLFWGERIVFRCLRAHLATASTSASRLSAHLNISSFRFVFCENEIKNTGDWENHLRIYLVQFTSRLSLSCKCVKLVSIVPFTAIPSG